MAETRTRCQALGCRTGATFMCVHHLALVPKDLRDQIAHTTTPDTPHAHELREQAIEHVARTEGRA